MKHSLLSASSAHRWLYCPGSVALCKDVERTDTEASLEGTKAHGLVEKMLKGDPYDGYDEEMISYCEAFVDYVRGIPGDLHSEVQVDYSHVTGLDDSFGTSDCVIVGEEAIHVIDFKYGLGKVYAERNPQLMLYALGAAAEERKLICHIFQPRIDWVDVWEFDIQEQVDFRKQCYDVAGKVVKALAAPGTHLKAGDQCQWCPIKGECKTYRDFAISDFDIEIEAPLLNNEEISNLLNKSKHLKNFLAAVEDVAFRRALIGENIPGWTLGEGRQGHRKWSGPVDEILSADDLYKTEVRSPSEIEKIYPRKKNPKIWQELDQMIERSPAKQVLVPASTSETETEEF